MRRKVYYLVVTVILLAMSGLGTGWTLAWLKSETKSIRNIFTVGSVKVQLTESFNTDNDGDGKTESWQGFLVPGTKLGKDPAVTISDRSENSWIFVHLQESKPLEKSNIHYTLADGWQPLAGSDGIYYREVDRDNPIRTYPVLKENRIIVSDTLTKDEGMSLGESALTVTAYAIQRAGFESPSEAWEQVKPTA